jgi:hypothetical protein
MQTLLAGGRWANPTRAHAIQQSSSNVASRRRDVGIGGCVVSVDGRRP